MNNNITQNNLKNISNSSETKDNSSFSNSNKSPPFKTPRQELYELILSKAPVSLWKLMKSTDKFSYTFIKRAVREFEFCRLIQTETLVNDSGRKEKMIYAWRDEE